ncbi:hypothetical protein AGIG_G5957 [Arapaima gigas]
MNDSDRANMWNSPLSSSSTPSSKHRKKQSDLSLPKIGCQTTEVDAQLKVETWLQEHPTDHFHLPDINQSSFLTSTWSESSGSREGPAEKSPTWQRWNRYLRPARDLPAAFSQPGISSKWPVPPLQARLLPRRNKIANSAKEIHHDLMPEVLALEVKNLSCAEPLKTGQPRPELPTGNGNMFNLKV